MGLYYKFITVVCQTQMFFFLKNKESIISSLGASHRADSHFYSIFNSSKGLRTSILTYQKKKKKRREQLPLIESFEVYF